MNNETGPPNIAHKPAEILTLRQQRCRSCEAALFKPRV